MEYLRTLTLVFIVLFSTGCSLIKEEIVKTSSQFSAFTDDLMDLGEESTTDETDETLSALEEQVDKECGPVTAASNEYFADKMVSLWTGLLALIALTDCEEAISGAKGSEPFTKKPKEE